MQLTRRLSVLAAAALAVALALPAAKATAMGRPCADLAQPGLFPGAVIGAAKILPADARTGLPAFCEVTATLSPTPGSHIGVVYRLPQSWNGRMLGLGGGGWAGNVRLATAGEGLAQGYATAQTDSGHPGTDATDLAWALAGPGRLDPDTIADFAYRAVHLMTVYAKQVVETHYGKASALAYFQGCSTGGRQGLLEAQRYPDDYDGIIAGAPVYDFLVQTSALLRTQFFHADPRSNLLPAQAALVNQAVLAACDAADGLKDGIITDPRSCAWDPGALRCRAGQEPPQCLTADQVATVRRMYAGLKTADGRVAAWPVLRGGEPDWVGRSIGTPQAPLGSNATTGSRAIPYLIYGDPDRPIMTMAPDVLLHDVAASPYAAQYEAGSPDLRAFTARGGKLILWHGLNDPGPSPLGTIRYYEAAQADQHRTGGKTALRLYLVPGIYHCGGGPGPDHFDMLTALDLWVEQGHPPQRIAAVNLGSGLTRPLCPYPALPVYRGKGDNNALASFACRAPRRSP